MATIQDLSRNVRNVASRRSSIFFREEIWDDAEGQIEYTWRHAGQIQGGDMSAEGVLSESDQDGRQKTMLFDIQISFIMQQATNTELSIMSDLVTLPDPNDNGLYANGIWVYVSGESVVQTPDVNNASTDGVITFGTGEGELDDLNGMVFTNAILNTSPSLDLSGDDGSTIEVSFGGRVMPEEFDDIESTHTINLAK